MQAGDHVNVTSGAYSGRRGPVVKVKNKVCFVFDEVAQEEFEVFARDLSSTAAKVTASADRYTSRNAANVQFVSCCSCCHLCICLWYPLFAHMARGKMNSHSDDNNATPLQAFVLFVSTTGPCTVCSSISCLCRHAYPC